MAKKKSKNQSKLEKIVKGAKWVFCLKKTFLFNWFQNTHYVRMCDHQN